MAASLPPITSRDNPVFKRVRSLQRTSVRNAERAFVVEGVRSVIDALLTGAAPELVLLSTDFANNEFEALIGESPVRTIAPPLFADLAGTVTPQGVLAIFPWPSPSLPPTGPELTLVADSISDPGNLGTLIRSAAAAWANRVLLTPGTVDPYNDKVVRSAMGSHFHIPIGRFDPAVDPPPESSVRVVLLSRDDGASSFESVDLRGPTWIVVGSEASGPGAAMRALASESAVIPMALGTESLNAAVAGSIMLFEAVRQRRIDPDLRKSPRGD